jgi:ubiquinone/menaquinone biosynthesis C-methylase UbiE
MRGGIPIAPFAIVSRLFGHRNFRRIEEVETLIAWLDIRPGDRILDVGCGDGFYDDRMGRLGASVVGIDVNERRLATARKRHLTGRTEFLHMDAEDMRFGDASFDKAVSFCVIEHFDRDDRVLEHLGRVVRPGGMLVLSADSLSNPELTDREREAHRRRYAVNTYYTEELLRRKLDSAGFRLERSRYILTSRFTLSLVRLSWALDDLPAPLLPLKGLGHAMLATLGRAASSVAESVAGRADSGLTLLARAWKR